MILKGKIGNLAESSGLLKVDMTIDKQQIGKILGMLSDLYSNKKSFIREWASNAWDAHIAADKRKIPIICRLTSTSVQIEDFGTGISPDAIENIVSKFGASTKDTDAEQLGAYGIGLKSGFAWKNQFTLVSYVDSIKYVYIFSKDNAGFSILNAGQFPTDRENGCLFEIEVTQNEREDIKKEIANLVFFDNIVFEGIDSHEFNTKVFRYKHFVFSTYATHKTSYEAFLILNQVRYRIDWNQLGIARIVLPLGIIVPQNENVIPIPTREDFYYTEQSIAQIKKCIKNTLQELKGLQLKQVSKPLELNEYFAKINKHALLAIDDTHVLDLSTELHNLPTYKLKGLEWYEDRQPSRLLQPLKVMQEIRSQKSVKSYLDFEVILRRQSPIFFSAKKKTKSSINRYIYRTKGRGYVVYPRILKLWGSYNYSKDSYYYILSLHRFPRKEWRSKIIEYQKFINNIITEHCFDYDAIKIPKIKTKWVKSSDMIGREIMPNGKAEHVSNVFHYIKRQKTIYTSDRVELTDWRFLKVNYNYSLLHVSKANEKILNKMDNNNLIHLDNRQKLIKIVGKGVMQQLFFQLFEEYNEILTSSSNRNMLLYLNSDLAKDIEYAENYIRSAKKYYNDNVFVQGIVDLVLHERRYDHAAMAVYNRLSYLLPHYIQLRVLEERAYSRSSTTNCRQMVAEKTMRYDQLILKKRLLSYSKMNSKLKNI